MKKLVFFLFFLIAACVPDVQEDPYCPPGHACDGQTSQINPPDNGTDPNSPPDNGDQSGMGGTGTRICTCEWNSCFCLEPGAYVTYH